MSSTNYNNNQAARIDERDARLDKPLASYSEAVGDRVRGYQLRDLDDGPAIVIDDPDMVTTATTGIQLLGGFGKLHELLSNIALTEGLEDLGDHELQGALSVALVSLGREGTIAALKAAANS